MPHFSVKVSNYQPFGSYCRDYKAVKFLIFAPYKKIVMPYPEQICAPMRSDLTSAGFEELRTPEAVDNTIAESKGSLLLVINSVCGCAAGTARPGVKLSLQKSDKKPEKMVTVFAGQDIEATNQARKYTLPYPPSSPSIALFKDGKLVHFVERHHIEGRSAEMIAENLASAYEEYC
jgi:putative YphP/YqiW family bacilliredoxin